MDEKTNVVTAGARLRQFRDYVGRTQAQFSAIIGTDQTYMSRLETGRERIGDDILYRLEQEYGVNRQWIETGTEPMLLASSTVKKQERDLARKLVAGLKLPNTASASEPGNLLVVTARDQGIFLRNGLDAALTRLPFPFLPGPCVAFEVTDSLMLPEYTTSSFIITTPLLSVQYMVKGLPYMIVTADRLYLRYFSAITENQIDVRTSTQTESFPLETVSEVYHVELKLARP